jgi:hypothetical protein
MAIRDDPHSDTNVLHFTILKPLLKHQLGITAFRIDELHHNENIDARLLQEIARSELVVADLTYERPSVYFEAGYAMGLKIPVVYTCRSDHLRRLSEYQVHFDLRQRNIVKWKDARDRTFPQRLVTRIRTTIAPLLRRREIDQKETEARQAFTKLSQEKRSELLTRESAASLRKLGFKTAGLPEDKTGRNPRVYRLSGSTVEAVTAHVLPSITKRTLEYLHLWGAYVPVPNVKKEQGRRHHMILVSESTVTRARVEMVFRDYAPAGEKTWISETTTDEQGKPHRSWLHIVDRVQSIPMLKRQLALLSSSRVFLR